MADTSVQDDGGRVADRIPAEEIPRRALLKKLAEKAVWIPPTVLTLQARKSFAASVVSVSI